jgi:hypothetical protein
MHDVSRFSYLSTINLQYVGETGGLNDTIIDFSFLPHILLEILKLIVNFTAIYSSKQTIQKRKSFMQITHCKIISSDFSIREAFEQCVKYYDCSLNILFIEWRL